MSTSLRAQLVDLGAKSLGRANSMESPLFGAPRTCELLLLEDGSAFIALGDRTYSLISRVGPETAVHSRVFPADTKTGSVGYRGDDSDRTYQSLHSDDAGAALAEHRKLVASVAARRSLAPAVLTQASEYEAIRTRAETEGRRGCRQMLALTFGGWGMSMALLAWKAPLLVTLVAALPLFVFWALWITPFLLGRFHRPK